jgi:hypothetical protein
MREILNYAPPATTTSGLGYVRFWGTFLLVGALSVPVSEMVASLYFREQELFTVGGLVLTSVCLLVAGGALAIARTISPKLFSSAIAAASFALVGPIIGIAAFCAVDSLL